MKRDNERLIAARAACALVLAFVIHYAAMGAAREGMMALVSRAGGAQCVVVSADASPCARTAAEEFVEWSSKMTGVRLPIRTDAEPLLARAVIVGRTRYTDGLLGGNAGEKFGEDRRRGAPDVVSPVRADCTEREFCESFFN